MRYIIREKLMRTAHINIRTEPETKKKAETILKHLGMNTSEAINIFLRKIILTRGLPFDVKLPNQMTLEAMSDIINKNNLTTYDNANGLFEEMGIAEKWKRQLTLPPSLNEI